MDVKRQLKESWQTASGKLTLVSAVVAVVTGALMMVQSLFFPGFLSAGGLGLRLELLCLLLAGVFGGYLAYWTEQHERARAEFIYA